MTEDLAPGKPYDTGVTSREDRRRDVMEIHAGRELTETLASLSSACLRLVSTLPDDHATASVADSIRRSCARAERLAAELIEQIEQIEIQQIQQIEQIGQFGGSSAGGDSASPLVTAGPFTLDPELRELVLGGQAHHLTKSEMEILRLLMERCDHFVPVESLLEQALGYPPAHTSPQILRTHIKNLRSKVEPDPRHPRWIVNRPGVGYCLAISSAS